MVQSSDILPEAAAKTPTINMENETIDRVAEQFPTEREQIAAYEKAQEGLVATQELRNIIGESLNPFLDQLSAVSKMIKHGKYEQQVIEVLKAMLNKVVEPKASEVLRVLKETILVRQRGRQLRENSIKAVKQLLKLCP